MIRSMTGYGKAIKELSEKRISVEIRSINSKQFDLNLRMPGFFREKEPEIRTLLSAKLERGKVDLGINVEFTGGQSGFTIDKKLIANYYNELKNIADENSIPCSDYLSILTRLPEVVKSVTEQVSEEDWEQILAAIQEAMIGLDEFRLHEGEILETDFRERIQLIIDYLIKTEPFEKQRIIAVKERIRKNLREYIEKENYDENRFEQELFYYLEKLDITEEKIRLKKHCDYFINTLKQDGFNGKKLNFITQEIGREINTLGSKANDAEMQMIVVDMKDELEKIKEQLLNIL